MFVQSGAKFLAFLIVDAIPAKLTPSREREREREMVKVVLIGRAKLMQKIATY
jgi:hypothetical protein